MNTRKSLQTIFGAIAAITALACVALVPTLGSKADGIGTGGNRQLGLPDLTIPFAMPGYSWENVESIYVYNQGNKPAVASTLGVTWSSGRFSKVFTYPVKALAPGEGKWILVDLGFYSQYDPGTHIKYQADYFNAVFESNESNNEFDKDN